MTETVLARTAEIFTTRLRTLGRLLDAAEAQWREKALDPEALLASRLAADMLPLPHQIVFACNQPNALAAWCTDGTAATTDPTQLVLAQLKEHIEATIGRLSEATAQLGDDVLEARNASSSGMEPISSSWAHLHRRLAEPNFYFHLVTAYDVLRHAGVQIGKADFMGHLAGHVRRPGQV